MRAFYLAAALAGLLCLPALAETSGFVERQDPDQWRASKLVGLDVLGPDGRKLGEVTDVLMDRDGRASVAVIGIGGVLGLGRKDVGLPYAALHVTDAARPGSAAPRAAVPGSAIGAPAPQDGDGAGMAAPAARGGPVGTTSGVPGGIVTGQAATPAPGAAGLVPALPPARPDHAAIDLTFDQLKAAPSFHFTP